MTWVAQIGSSLLIPSGGCNHLHIVCSDPMNFPGWAARSCLLLSISTTVPKCDRTLVLDRGDHPFIDHESFVFYRKALVEQAQVLEQLVAKNVYTAHQPAYRALVKKIVARMDQSDFTRGDMLKVCKQVWESTNWQEVANHEPPRQSSAAHSDSR